MTDERVGGEDPADVWPAPARTLADDEVDDGGRRLATEAQPGALDAVDDGIDERGQSLATEAEPRAPDAVDDDSTPHRAAAVAPPGGEHDGLDTQPRVAVSTWSAASAAGSPREQWSMVALLAAAIGALPFTWPVPILSLMAIGFGLVGIRNCQLDGLWRNRWMAVLAIGVGLATLAVAMILTGLGRIQFLPFWTRAA